MSYLSCSPCSTADRQSDNRSNCLWTRCAQNNCSNNWDIPTEIRRHCRCSSDPCGVECDKPLIRSGHYGPSNTMPGELSALKIGQEDKETRCCIGSSAGPPKVGNEGCRSHAEKVRLCSGSSAIHAHQSTQSFPHSRYSTTPLRTSSRGLLGEAATQLRSPNSARSLPLLTK